jgi:hypothetical protein
MSAAGNPDRALQATLAADGDVATLDFRTLAQTSVRFTVRASDGTPLSGVTASAARFAQPTLTATTDATGTAFLGSFFENQFLTLTLTDPQNRFAPVTRTRLVLPADDDRTIPFDWVVGLTGTISGQVVDADGVPLGGARVDHVDALSGQAIRSVIAGADGRFAFGDIADVLGEATASVMVRAVPDIGGVGYFPEALAGTERRTFTAVGQVLDGPVTAPVLRGSVIGVVTAPGGGLDGLSPLVVVWLPGGSYYSVGLVNPATGAFASAAATLLPAGPFTLTVLVNGLDAGLVQRTVALARPANTAAEDFDVPGFRTLVTGRVFADAARTIPAAGVYPRITVPQVVAGVPRNVDAFGVPTGTDGRFSVVLFVPDSQLRVRIDRPDGSLVREFVETVNAPGTIALEDVSLGVSVVRVTVRGVAGQAVYPTTITLTDSASEVRYPSTIEDSGAAVFLQVPAGPFSVNVVVDGLGPIAGSGTLATGTDVLELTLQYQQTGITGAIVAVDGVTPISGRTFTVTATNQATSQQASVVSTDNTFRFEAGFAEAGHTVVVVAADEENRELGRVEVVLASAFDVVDVPVSVVKGLVALGPNGEFSPGAPVEVNIDRYDPDTGDLLWSAFYTTTADQEGRYAVPAVPCGEVRVTAYAEETRSKSGTLGCPVSTLVIDFLNTRVEGVVRHFDGTPVAYPNVYLEQVDESGNTQYYYPDVTDEDGNYRITGMLPGAFVLSASSSFLSRSESGTLSGASATVDVTLPEDMTVTGTVTDDSGAVVPQAQVRLETAFFVLFGTADASGVYRFEHMPVASGTVRAQHPQSGRTGTAPLTGVPLQTVVVDVVIPR